MATKPVLLFAAIFMVYARTNVVYCSSGTTTSCQGTECTLEDLQATTNTELLQNLTASFASIVQGQLKIHITHDYQNCARSEVPSDAPSTSTPPVARDCNDIAAQGHDTSGIYKIRPRVYPISPAEKDTEPFAIYCDLVTDGGNWTVFQHRQSAAIDFYRDWLAYKEGFGYVNGDYWLGLEKLHQMTATANYELRVELEDFNGNQVYAHYDSFQIGDEHTFYKLILGAYEGTAGDSLTYHDNMPFSTKDQDHDLRDSSSCAQDYKGGWWYNECHWSNLNGYYVRSTVQDGSSMSWYHWKNEHESLKKSEMKIRRVD